MLEIDGEKELRNCTVSMTQCWLMNIYIYIYIYIYLIERNRSVCGWLYIYIYIYSLHIWSKREVFNDFFFHIIFIVSIPGLNIRLKCWYLLTSKILVFAALLNMKSGDKSKFWCICFINYNSHIVDYIV